MESLDVERDKLKMALTSAYMANCAAADLSYGERTVPEPLDLAPEIRVTPAMRRLLSGLAGCFTTGIESVIESGLID